MRERADQEAQDSTADTVITVRNGDSAWWLQTQDSFAHIRIQVQWEEWPMHCSSDLACRAVEDHCTLSRKF